MSYQPDLSKVLGVDKHLVYCGTFFAEIWGSFFMLRRSNMMAFVGTFSLTFEIGSGCVYTICGQVDTKVLRSVSG